MQIARSPTSKNSGAQVFLRGLAKTGQLFGSVEAMTSKPISIGDPRVRPSDRTGATSVCAMAVRCHRYSTVTSSEPMKR